MTTPDTDDLVIGNRRFSPRRPLVIGEVAQSHDGSLGLAHSFVDAVATAGADAVKFQTHIADAESTPDEPWRVTFSRQDKTRYEYWKRMEFSETQWRGLREHATERGLLFLSSPFSIEAVRMLERIEVPAWKIASGEIRNVPMLRAIAETRLPVLLSTGMSALDEIDRTVELFRDERVPLVVLQCTSEYPCPPEKIGVNVLDVFRERYGVAVGLSDHSGTIYPGLAAAVLGASVIEVHVTLSKEMFGPDVLASITPGELRLLVDGVRFVARMHASPVMKDALPPGYARMRSLFMRSLVLRRDLPAGAEIREEDLTAKKPGTGIPAERWAEFIGRRLRRAVRKDEVLHEEHFEPTDPRGRSA